MKIILFVRRDIKYVEKDKVIWGFMLVKIIVSDFFE